MAFTNRRDAARLLSECLKTYQKQPNTIILGLARGGVVCAHELAQNLGLPFDVVCPRKIGTPLNPELALGAVTETGDCVINDDVALEYGINDDYIQTMTARKAEEALQRASTYRKGRSKLDLEGKTVILVDDGIATGATMKASIKMVRNLGAEKIVVAIPVGAISTLNELQRDADEVVCLVPDPGMHAVGAYYYNFLPVEDFEVMKLLGYISPNE